MTPPPMTAAQMEAAEEAVRVGRAPAVPLPDRPLAASPAPSRRLDRSRGFGLSVEGLGELGCGDIRGFREAALAAVDPRAPLPQRLVLVGPESELRAWLVTFAEDSEQVRRSLTIYRHFDGKAIRAVVTIASFGHGVETALAVESVSGPRGEGDDEEIFRSGVHRKADIEAALARHEAGAGRAREGVGPTHVGETREGGLGDFG